MLRALLDLAQNKKQATFTLRALFVFVCLRFSWPLYASSTSSSLAVITVLECIVVVLVIADMLLSRCYQDALSTLVLIGVGFVVPAFIRWYADDYLHVYLNCATFLWLYLHTILIPMFIVHPDFIDIVQLVRTALDMLRVMDKDVPLHQRVVVSVCLFAVSSFYMDRLNRRVFG